MLKNLFKTWEILAPNEIQIVDEYSILLLKISGKYRELKSTEFLSTCEQDKLQGYIRRCILTRNGVIEGKEQTGLLEQKVCIPSQSPESYVTRGENALLVAYLTSLASIRTVTVGSWECFNGGDAEVVGVANPVDAVLDDKAIGIYQLTDAPEQTAYLLNNKTFAIFSFYWDYKDRVFYSHNGNNWAMPVDQFLGLVGSESPDHEGLLRFTEVSQ
jgi:hypothetical protein